MFSGGIGVAHAGRRPRLFLGVFVAIRVEGPFSASFTGVAEGESWIAGASWDGTLERIHHAIYVAVREQEGREASPTAAVIDSQTAKGAQKGGASLDPSGQAARPGAKPMLKCVRGNT
jgi:hypothetical protein